MTSFLQTFGASAVSPSEVAFAEYSFGTNLTLYWPQFSAGQTNVAARFMNLTATVNSLDVLMPDASLVSVGYDVIIFNLGTHTFNVVDSQGGAIATIATGQTYYLILNDNTTQAGEWQTVQFGVGTGSASAAALAGAGLLAAAGLLNVNFDATTVSGSYSITSAQRAILQVWNGGSGTITLPAAASVGDGFFFPFANNGSGSVTIAASGGEQIDGGSTSVFTQTQSGFIISSGTAWFTVGKGIQNTFAVTILNLNVAGSADVTETSAQAQNIIQQFTGILTGNINVIVPNTAQIYFLYNNTSGAYTLTFKTAAGTGVEVTQGTNTIVYCDGTNVVGAFTSSIGSSITLPVGSAGAPTLNFTGTTNTGLYSPTTGQMAITAGGKEVMNFLSAASSVNYLQAQATATGNAPIIAAAGSDSNIGIILSPKGSGAVGMASAVILGGTIDGTVIGGSSAAAIHGTTGNFSSTLSTTQLTSTIATGTAPFVVSSTTQVANLNAATAGSATTATTATNATNTAITDDTTTNATMYPTWVTANTGNLPQKVSSTKISFNPSSGLLTSTGFVGPLTGNVTGNCSGSSGSTSGNAATATALANGRTISITGDLAYTSPSFDGSGNVTAAGTLATVNSNVGSFTNASVTVNAKGLVTAASSGTSPAMILLSAQTVSNAASLNFTGFMSSTYRIYKIYLYNIFGASAAALWARYGISASYISTTTYNSSLWGRDSAGNTEVADNPSAAQILMSGANLQATSTQGGAWEVTIFNPSHAAETHTIWNGSYKTDSLARYNSHVGSGQNTGTSAITDIQFLMASGNISATGIMYGIV